MCIVIATSNSFTILGLWVLGLAVSNINESQLQTHESKTLFLMSSLQYYCIPGLAGTRWNKNLCAGNKITELLTFQPWKFIKNSNVTWNTGSWARLHYVPWYENNFIRRLRQEPLTIHLVAKRQNDGSFGNWWLSDTIIDQTQAVLRQQFPHDVGMQSVIYAAKPEFQPVSGRFVQIINIHPKDGGLHWICFSNFNCDDGIVNLYDSSGEIYISTVTERAVAKIICTPTSPT